MKKVLFIICGFCLLTGLLTPVGASYFESVFLLGSNGELITAQNPLPTDGDSIYDKDLDLVRTDTTGWTGDVEDLFGDLTQGLSRADATNPKVITVYFQRTVVTNAVGFGAEGGGNFSNVKVTGLFSGGAEIVLYDNSSDNTDLTTLTVQFTTLGAVGFKVEFLTADPVTLTNFVVLKIRSQVSQVQAAKDDGTVVNIGATDAGNLKTTDAENGLAIAKGDVAGTTFVHKFGEASDIDTGDGYVPIWDGANATDGIKTYTYSTTADIDTLSSSNAGDTQQVEVQGLDTNYDLVTQTITLTGQTPVSLTTNLLRVFRMKNIGSVDFAGSVYCWVSGGGSTGGVPNTNADVRAIVQGANNQTLMALYTVPAGKTGYVRDLFFALSRNLATTSQVRMFIRPFGEVFQLKYTAALDNTGTSYIKHLYEEPEVVLEKSDIYIEANAFANNTGVSAGFDLVLIDN